MNLLLLPIFLASIASPDVPDPARLRWRNGESVPGEMVQASSEAVTWKTSLFQDPLVLHWSAVSRIDQPRPAKASDDPFTIVMRDGSHLCGDLVSIAGDVVNIRSARVGEVALKRAEVLSVRRRHGGALLFSGPVGDIGWEEAQLGRRNREQPELPIMPGAEESKVAMVTTGLGGALSLPYWNRGARLELELPPKVDVLFRVRSSARPDFSLVLAGPGTARARLETWDEVLVLASDDQFREVRVLPAEEHSVELRLCWDRQAGNCEIYSAAGERLAQWHTPESKTELPPGIYLQNKGRDLALELLEVHNWDGTPPSKINPESARLEKVDGSMVEGDVDKMTDRTITMRVRPGEAAGATFPVNELEGVVFSTDAPKVSEAPAKVTFADGTLLFGRIAGFEQGHLLLETSFDAQPLPAVLDGFRQLLVQTEPPTDAAPEPPLAQLDRLTVHQTTLHGRAVSVEDGTLRWVPAGGVSPVRPSAEMESEIIRATAPAAMADLPALFYTGYGDILPGRLRALDRTGVDFESPYLEATRLPADGLEAIQFGVGSTHAVHGFEDPGWRIVKGDEKTVVREKGVLRIQPGSSIGHAAVMQGRELHFSMPAADFNTVRLRLFCAGTEGPAAASVLLFRWTNRLTCGLEADEGQLESQNNLPITPNENCEIRLAIEEQAVVISVNNTAILTVPIDAGKRQGSGLVIEPASMWGNQVVAVSLSNFSSEAAPGRTFLPEVNKEAKLHALTIPRFRHDDPPRQVLVAANGDVLRGEIEAATATALQFRSGLETLRVPIDRVRAAIWLKQPEGAPDAAMHPEPVSKELEARLPHAARFGMVNLPLIINYLQQQVPGLKIHLAPEAKDQRRSMSVQVVGQTVGEALDHVCAAFGMRSRVLANGEVLVESASKSLLPEDMVQKAYWLKAGSFPDIAAAQKTLSDKGVDFPPGSVASWQPKAQQLTMVNTAANQAKLGEVLAADFGGSLGSPTHWLQCTNGARLSLAVDKFEHDFIVGHHPFYGKCRLPMADILSIRTAAFPATPARALQGWQLVFAAEPVIPDSGGDSSPTLGQDVKPFKLPLLDGGEFDLAEKKGKVIVLDFWATWCGPCVKSLPGLIEVMGKFPGDKVELVGLDQAEPPDLVKKFLSGHDWKLKVAMDSAQEVARQFGVEGIPHTVIVGPDGKVAWVNTGYRPDGDEDAAKAVQKLLDGTPAAPAANP